MLLFWALENYFGTWEGYLVSVSLGKLAVLMIGTGEGCLVGLSLRLPLVSPLESPNPGADSVYLFVSLNGMVLGMSLGNRIGSLLDSI